MTQPDRKPSAKPCFAFATVQQSFTTNAPRHHMEHAATGIRDEIRSGASHNRRFYSGALKSICGCPLLPCALSDFSYTTYLSDLAVRLSHQRGGIGRELIRRTREAAGLDTALVLLSAPAAVEYYPRIGFTQHPSAWWLRAGDGI